MTAPVPFFDDLEELIPAVRDLALTFDHAAGAVASLRKALETEEDRRLARIETQRALGRTGGGPACPRCKRHSLYHLENDERWQCRDCYVGVRILVTPNGIEAKRVDLPERRRGTAVRYERPTAFDLQPAGAK